MRCGRILFLEFSLFLCQLYFENFANFFHVDVYLTKKLDKPIMKAMELYLQLLNFHPINLNVHLFDLFKL